MYANKFSIAQYACELLLLLVMVVAMGLIYSCMRLNGLPEQRIFIGHILLLHFQTELEENCQMEPKYLNIRSYTINTNNDINNSNNNSCHSNINRQRDSQAPQLFG